MSDDNYTKPKQEINQQTGLPVVSEEEKASAMRKAGLMAILLPLFVTAVGYGIACAIYHFGETEKYDERINIAKDYDL